MAAELRAGAGGFLLKGARPEELVADVHAGIAVDVVAPALIGGTRIRSADA